MTAENLSTEKLLPENAAQVADRIRSHLQAYLHKEQPDFKELVGDDMSFDYMGLDSLARVDLLTGLEKEFGVSLDPTAGYDFITVRSLAEFVWSVISGTPLDLIKTFDI
jgi:acyl carrier protein